jgi:hypothetical protein
MNIEELREYWWRLKQLEEDDMLDVLKAKLTKKTWDALLLEMTAHVDIAKAEATEEREDAIRKLAEKLPDGNEMKDAIDGVS